MKISELLKLIRTLTGKTQKEFSEGIMTESYYSKVERGIHQINADSFFELINKNYSDPKLERSIRRILVAGENTKRLEKISNELSKTLSDEEQTRQYYEKLYKEVKELNEEVPHSVYLNLLSLIVAVFPNLLNEQEKELLRIDLKKINSPTLITSSILLRLQYTTSLYSTAEIIKLMKILGQYIMKNKKDTYLYLKFAEVVVIGIFHGRYEKNEELREEVKKMLDCVLKLDPHNTTFIYIKIHIYLYEKEVLGEPYAKVNDAVSRVVENILPNYSAKQD
ncbi:helix-turn-helix transcriptional regulator [Lactobacillus sp. PV037]|uniref:helix-turn-helix domain-containing protein n=1 Tax=unclassified Lactobacillus TaxID=2620435 RepID=UPI002240548C|nr:MULTISPECIES: helix-turn-helix transcriptional regulator [unclassified Lactobacillus]QNQ82200.1 helix-turn-helix transcriptional regulator [Lactobacillus sp. PV012]QNQ83692.1 helix-turn-helix transcriptional regulator [Lactobacillus sp. PV037]